MPPAEPPRSRRSEWEASRWADVGSVDLSAIEQFFVAGIPFNTFVGLELVEIERGRAVARIPFRPELIGDPTRPALHGGVISMLADTIGGAAVFSVTDPGDRVATIDLRVDYLLPGREADVYAEALVIRVGNRVGVASMRCWQPATTGEDSIAVAKGVYTIKRLDGSSRS
ncbi:MAG: hotdog fold thioesterase [Planctomycetes bacterium]|nr:hotdog fold thioesterase [Planctomycetota bacterium]